MHGSNMLGLGLGLTPRCNDLTEDSIQIKVNGDGLDDAPKELRRRRVQGQNTCCIESQCVLIAVADDKTLCLKRIHTI